MRNKKLLATALLPLSLTQSVSAWFGNNEQKMVDLPSQVEKIPDQRRSISLRDPFEIFRSDPFFNNVWQPSFNWPEIKFNQSYPLDLYQSGESLIIEIEVPGFEKEDITLEVQQDQYLSIKGLKRVKTEASANHKYFYRERGTQSFSRLVTLPHPVKVAETEAELTGQTLKITLPIRVAEHKTTISID